MENKAKFKKRIFLIICFAVIFTIIAILVKSGASAGFDNKIRLFAYSTRKDWLNVIMLAITQIASPKGIILVIVVLLVLPWTRVKFGLPVGIATGLSYLFYKFLKIAFARPRPDVLMWLTHESDLSFPSGHSMNGLICYVLIAILIQRYIKNKKLANTLSVLLVILVAVIGLTRIYLGVHYMTDVLAGWSMGIVCVTMALMVHDKIIDIRKERGKSNGK